MASKTSSGVSNIHCKVCNLFMDATSYQSHVQGKKHKSNVWKSNKAWVHRRETKTFIKPQYTLEGPASLDVQFQSLLNQVLLTQEECNSLTSRILHDLEPCLTREFRRCCPFVFGSMATGLALVGSDVDLYLETEVYHNLRTLSDPKPELEKVVKRCARALRTDRRFTNIVPISQARVPIVKLVHRPSDLSCDLSFKDPFGVHNSQLLRFYLQLNPRYFEVMVAIKFWAKVQDLCATDCISSYGWTLLFISYLQSVTLPNGSRLVPSVSQLQKDVPPAPGSIVNGWRVDFHPREHFVALPEDPKFSHRGLLKGFFDYYNEFPFRENIVCPFLGQPIPWAVVDPSQSEALPPEYQWYEEALNKALSEKVATHHIVCIQDPFQQDFLVGGSCNEKKFRRVVDLFKAAAQICQSEEELTDPNSSTLLADLFSFKLVDYKVKFSLKLNVLAGIVPKDLSVGVFEMLEDIFTKILKFQVEKDRACARPQGEPDTKVPKTSESQDVHQKNVNTATAAKYQCVTLHPVWRARKKSRKDVKLAFPETAFEFEQKLSDVIVGRKNPSERLEFSCSVVLRKSPCLEVVLEQLEGRNDNMNIKELFEFLRCTLPLWLTTFLREKFAECSTVPSLRLEPSSSTDVCKEGVEGSDISEAETVQPAAQSTAQTEAELEALQGETREEPQTEADLEEAQYEALDSHDGGNSDQLDSQMEEMQSEPQSEAKLDSQMEEMQSEPQAEADLKSQFEEAQ